jgi:hypothetical protein
MSAGSIPTICTNFLGSYNCSDCNESNSGFTGNGKTGCFGMYVCMSMIVYDCLFACISLCVFFFLLLCFAVCVPVCTAIDVVSLQSLICICPHSLFPVCNYVYCCVCYDYIQRVDINECVTNNGGCEASHNCTNTFGSFTCSCMYGTTEIGGICVNVNECM